jgi:CubicO group peptidase (beta-lactamase class C family)
MNRRAFFTTAGAALAAGAALRGSRQAKVPDGRVDDILALVRRKMTEYHVPGVGLGLWHDQTLHLHGVGVTSLDDPRPVTPDTLFTIASISKTMTATAVMRLVEQGRLDLDAPVRRALPEFQVRDEAASASVTPWHLLTHTPGWEGQLTTDDRGAEALTHFVSTIMPALPQLAPPGRVWSYNNAGFALAGRLLEVVTGRPVHDALRELVFAPLGLPRTFTRLTEAMTFPVTLGHRDRDGATEVIRPFQTTSSTTAGGVLTSLSDLMRYARFHLGDVVPEAAYVTARRLTEMQTVQVRKHGTDDEMGIGWHLRRLGDVTTLAHGGTLNGHCLLIELVPSQRLAFTILTNHVDGWRLVQDVEQAILGHFAGVGLAPGQRIGHRGVNEALSLHSRPLVQPPDPAPYVGTYSRRPVGEVVVRRHGAGLVVATGAGQPDAAIVFYGTDVAYATSGNYVGFPYEFIRADDGAVGWIRVNGRIARRTA